MARLVILDATVLVAYSNPDDSFNEAAVEIIADNMSSLVAHQITISEYLVLPARNGGYISALAAQRYICGDLQVEMFIPRASDWASQLALVRAQTRLKMPDAIVLATAEHLRGAVASFDNGVRQAALKRGLEVLPELL